MNNEIREGRCWRHWVSPLGILLLAANALCFGMCLVLLSSGRGSGPLIVVTLATGLSMGAGVIGAVMAWRKIISLHSK